MSSRIKAIGAIAVFSATAITVHGFGLKIPGPPQNPVTTGPVGPPAPGTGPTAAQAPTAKPAPTPPPDPDGQVIKSEKQTFKIEVIARDIETPWALAFLPDG